MIGAIFIISLAIINYSLKSNNYQTKLSLKNIIMTAKASGEDCLGKHYQFYECYHYASGWDCMHLSDPQYYGYCDDE